MHGLTTIFDVLINCHYCAQTSEFERQIILPDLVLLFTVLYSFLLSFTFSLFQTTSVHSRSLRELEDLKW